MSNPISRAPLTQALWPILCGLLASVLLILFLNRQLGDSKTNDISSAETLNAGSFKNAVARSAPAVVNIYTRQTVLHLSHPLMKNPKAQALFGTQNRTQESIQSGLGSGVIMNKEGYILTNYHVVKDADEILVELSNKRSTRAKVIGADIETDLAVLKISLENIPYIEELANDVSVGDIALAIGNPLGIGQTVTMGIVSATGRSNLGLSTYESFIQTDASINRGNSGGALIDSQGRLMGINSVIFSKSGGSDGIGLAIPAPLAKQVLDSIIEHGRVIRGWLGADFQKLNIELANYLQTEENHGVVIVNLLKNGPAQNGGIEVGDLIIEIDGRKIVQENDALAAIAEVKPGEQSTLKIIRNRKPITLSVNVGERPNPRTTN